MGSSRAEEWYIARLTDEATWERGEQAARTLGEMKSVRAVRPVLDLIARFGQGCEPCGHVFITGIDLPDSMNHVLRSLCLSREILCQIGPPALDELARIRADEAADEVL